MVPLIHMWLRIKILLLIIFVLSSCSSGQKQYMIIFNEKNGLNILKYSKDPFQNYNTCCVELKYSMPMEYILSRNEYELSIKHSYSTFHSIPDFLILAKSKYGDEHFYIKSKMTEGDCISIEDRMITFQKDPSEGFHLLWHSTSIECDQLQEKLGDFLVDIEIYNSNRKMIGRERLYATHILNGKSFYK